MESAPAGRAEVVIEATPPDTGTVPSEVAPTVNATEPVGVPEPVETVAVRVTEVPTETVVALAPSVVVVLGSPITVITYGLELDEALKLESPL
jgi:hypothetical protein